MVLDDGIYGFDGAAEAISGVGSSRSKEGRLRFMVVIGRFTYGLFFILSLTYQIRQCIIEACSDTLASNSSHDDSKQPFMF